MSTVSMSHKTDDHGRVQNTTFINVNDLEKLDDLAGLIKKSRSDLIRIAVSQYLVSMGY